MPCLSVQEQLAAHRPHGCSPPPFPPLSFQPPMSRWFSQARAELPVSCPMPEGPKFRLPLAVAAAGGTLNVLKVRSRTQPETKRTTIRLGGVTVGPCCLPIMIVPPRVSESAAAALVAGSRTLVAYEIQLPRGGIPSNRSRAPMLQKGGGVCHVRAVLPIALTDSMRCEPVEGSRRRRHRCRCICCA